MRVAKSDSLKYYLDIYDILNSITPHVVCKEILDYIPFTKQYCIVKGFRKLDHWDIKKTLEEFTIVNTTDLFDVFSYDEASKLTECDRPFYGGIVRNKFFIKHRTSGIGYVVGMTNIENFYEYIESKCKYCGWVKVIRRKGKKVNDNGCVVGSIDDGCLSCQKVKMVKARVMNGIKERKKVNFTQKWCVKYDTNDNETGHNKLKPYTGSSVKCDDYCYDCKMPLMFINLKMCCGFCKSLKCIDKLGKYKCSSCGILNNVNIVKCKRCFLK